MGFNSAFKGLMSEVANWLKLPIEWEQLFLSDRSE
jgi:hypothetical protein